MTSEEKREHFESLIAGILSAVKSAEDYLSRNTREDFSTVSEQLMSADFGITRLRTKVTK